ncbi:MAG TPA: hypothetical protein VFY20_10085, partial [Gemmatimonadales bacterium]|nr:hypothetical protein [Gemmatimonadales bacterium]
VVGRRELMELLTPRAARSWEGRPYVFHGGTYNGTPIAIAAGMAVIDLLEDASSFEDWMTVGEILRAQVAGALAEAGEEAQVFGRGAVADFYFTGEAIRSSREIWASDLARRRAVDYHLLAAGVYNAPLHRWHLSLAHTEDDIARSVEALRAAVRAARA